MYHGTVACAIQCLVCRGGPKNDDRAVPVHENQSITRAEFRAALLALSKKQPGVKRHSVQPFWHRKTITPPPNCFFQPF